MKSIATAILAAILLAVSACSPAPSSTAVLSTTFDMTTASKAAYAARASYYGYLVVADKIKKNVPICSASTQADICITTDQMAVLKTTELSTDQATLAGEKAVLALGNSPTAIETAIVASKAAVASFKAQTDIWKDRVKS